MTPSFDTKFNSAKALLITGNVFGAFAFFTLVMSSCCPLSQQRLKGLSCYFTLATLFTGLSLLIFKSSACSKCVVLSSTVVYYIVCDGSKRSSRGTSNFLAVS